MSENFNKALEFVKEYHDGQYHSNVPVWHHLARVAERLAFISEYNQEGTAEEREVLSVSALGHDLLEDTKATREEIQNIFGEAGSRLIDGMTNTWGDNDVTPYVKKISDSPEEVRLIKLSDLFDNLSAVTYHLVTLGKEWANSYFLPIVTPMKEAIMKTSFDKYNKTGEDLKFMVATAFSLLHKELDKI